MSNERNPERLANNVTKNGIRSRGGPLKANPGRRGHDPELRWEIVNRISAGESLEEICREPRMPAPKTFWEWTRTDPELWEAYEKGKRLRASALFEHALAQLDTIVDRDTAYIADVRCRNLMKAAALLDPERYSDKTHSNLHKISNGNAVQINIVIGGQTAQTIDVAAQENS